MGYGNSNLIYQCFISSSRLVAHALQSIMVNELTALSGNDFDVGEISAHSAAAPEADQPFLAVAQLSDD